MIGRDAIELLESQHREVEQLFAEIEDTAEIERRQLLFDRLVDRLALYMTLEERFFYEGCRADETLERIEASYDEHDSVRRILSDLLDRGADDLSFAARLESLKEEVQQHVENEEEMLFPLVRQLVSEIQLDAMGEAMASRVAELEAAASVESSEPYVGG